MNSRHVVSFSGGWPVSPVSLNSTPLVLVDLGCRGHMWPVPRQQWEDLPNWVLMFKGCWTLNSQIYYGFYVFVFCKWYMPNYGKLCTCASIPSDLWLQGRHPSSILEKEKDDCYTVGVCWWRVVFLRVVNGCCLVEVVVGQRSEPGGAHHFRTMWRQNKWLQRPQLFHSHLSTLSHCQLEEAQLRILHITVAWTNKLAFRLFSIFRHGSHYVSCWATQ